MKVKELRQILDKLDNEEAVVMLRDETSISYWLHPITAGIISDFTSGDMVVIEQANKERR